MIRLVRQQFAVILCGCLPVFGAGCVPVPVRWAAPQTLPAAIRLIDQDTLTEVREALVLTVWRSREGTWMGESYFGSTSDRLIRPQIVKSGDRFFPDHGVLHWEVEWWPWPAATTRKEERFYRLVVISPGYESQTTDLSSRDESALDIWPRHVDVRLKAATDPRTELERIRHLLLNRRRLSSKDQKQWAIMGEFPLHYSTLEIAFTPEEQRFIDRYLTKSIGDLAQALPGRSASEGTNKAISHPEAHARIGRHSSGTPPFRCPNRDSLQCLE